MKNQETKEIYELLKQARVKLEKLSNKGIRVEFTKACDTCDNSLTNAMFELRNIDKLLG